MYKKLLVFIPLLLAGCTDDGETDCASAINDVVSKHGQPEEINKYDSGGYHSHTYWYWCSGFSYDFTWGSDVGSCETSLYQFTPICSTSRSSKINPFIDK